MSTDPLLIVLNVIQLFISGSILSKFHQISLFDEKLTPGILIEW